MASCIKIIVSSVFILLLIVVSVLSAPGKSHQRVRIHVPVKHHTHVITKTKVKTVHIGIPIKESKPHWDEDWAYSKKRPKIRLPDVDDDIDYR